jgi:hypothetical protein
VAQTLAYVGFASADALQTIDGTHFDSAGVVSLGQRFAAALEVPPLKFIGATRNGGNLLFTAAGLGGASCRVLSSANLTVPIAQWAPVSSNTFDPQGRLTFMCPAPPETPRQFYVIQMP